MQWLRYRVRSQTGFVLFLSLVGVASGVVVYLLVVRGNLSPLINNTIAWERVGLISLLLSLVGGAMFSLLLLLIDIVVPARRMFFRTVYRKVALVIISTVLTAAALWSVALTFLKWTFWGYVIFLTLAVFIYNRIHAYRKDYAFTTRQSATETDL